jgi:hypothetical protein
VSDEATCSQNMQWAWRTQAPSACSPQPAPRARRQGRRLEGLHKGGGEDLPQSSQHAVS